VEGRQDIGGGLQGKQQVHREEGRRKALGEALHMLLHTGTCKHH